ncbi:MAG: tetratricopeptide repeat protein [Bryobacteraceae bacterium]|nr:tetratricopeptide repeat protein [Bryobacteraceae bacterium]
MNSKAFRWFLALALCTVPQALPQSASNGQKVDKASAYYNFAMGHLYAELAQAYNNRGEYVDKAIEHYRLALKADPNASQIAEELAELYIQANKLRDAVTETEEALKANPDDLNMRRLLARIYTRLIGDTQQNRVNEEYLKKAIEQYEKIAAKTPKDSGTWLMLGRLYKVSQNSPESEKAFKKALEIDPENEEVLTGLAMVYADVGDTKSAADLLKKASDKNPSVRTLAALAAAYEQLRDHANAAAALRKALEIAPQNPEIKRGLAQNLLFADQYDEALKLFQEIVAEEPKDALAWMRISQIYRQKQDFVKAHEASNKAHDADPNNLEIRFNEVSLLEAEGKFNEAIDGMQSLLASTSKRNYNPGERGNRAILLERLGYMQRTAERYDDAVATFRQIAQLDEDQGARASVHVIETYRQARKVDKAFEEAQAARQKYPKDRTVGSMYAFIAADAGKAADAERVGRELLNEKKDREGWISVAQIYERTKNYAEMAKALDEAEKLSKDQDEKEGVFFMRGAMYEKMKKFDAAEGEFRKVLASNPKNVSALNYLGYMLADRNVRLKEAHELIRQAVDKEPDNGAYLDSLGWVLYRMNRLSEAEDYLKKAVARTGKDPTVHDHLGDVYFKQGKLKEAITHWQRSVAEWEASPASELDRNELAKVQKKLDNAKVKLAREERK